MLWLLLVYSPNLADGILSYRCIAYIWSVAVHKRGNLDLLVGHWQDVIDKDVGIAILLLLMWRADLLNELKEALWPYDLLVKDTRVLRLELDRLLRLLSMRVPPLLAEAVVHLGVELVLKLPVLSSEDLLLLG